MRRDTGLSRDTEGHGGAGTRGAGEALLSFTHTTHCPPRSPAHSLGPGSPNPALLPNPSSCPVPPLPCPHTRACWWHCEGSSVEVAPAISRRKRSCCFESETQKRGTERVGLAGPVLPPCTADPSAVPALRPHSRPDSRCWAARGRRGAAGTAQHGTVHLGQPEGLGECGAPRVGAVSQGRVAESDVTWATQGLTASHLCCVWQQSWGGAGDGGGIPGAGQLRCATTSSTIWAMRPGCTLSWRHPSCCHEDVGHRALGVSELGAVGLCQNKGSGWFVDARSVLEPPVRVLAGCWWHWGCTEQGVGVICECWSALEQGVGVLAVPLHAEYQLLSSHCAGLPAAAPLPASTPQQCVVVVALSTVATSMHFCPRCDSGRKSRYLGGTPLLTRSPPLLLQ